MGTRYSMEELKRIEALVEEGFSNREIAERLDKSEAGIRNLRYRKRLTRKTKDEIKALLHACIGDRRGLHKDYQQNDS